MPKAGDWGQSLRLGSGLVLFAFALTHFLNHALGIVSVDLMETVQDVRRGFWRFPPINLLLYAALILHVVLALWKTARRASLRMHWWEWAQLLLGLAIPYLLIPHVIGTRALNAQFGLNDTYTFELSVLWPGLAFDQSLLLVLVWVHAMIGLHFWLSGRPWYDRLLPVFGGLALAVPLLSLWGWIEAARRLHLAGEADGRFTREQLQWAAPIIETINMGLLGLLGVVAVFVLGRLAYQRIRRTISVEYPGQIVVRAAPGPTLLEISRINDIPHTSVCGGRARCSTCRVRVLEGADALEPPSEHECDVLRRVGADNDVRLACQIRPRTDLNVRPLLPIRDAALKPGRSVDAYHWGVEQQIAVMFVDIRNFTGISEKRLSYDVVFFLNRYLERMSTAIEDAGGHVDKYIGDGIMALFGISVGRKEGCRNALRAAIAMERELQILNQELADHLDEPLRIGIGIHAGPAILGRIGAAGSHGGTGNLTALGDTVNTASRLEAATKELGGMLAVSSDVWRSAGLTEDEALVRHISVRGRETALKVFSLESPSILEDDLSSDPETGSDASRLRIA